MELIAAVRRFLVHLLHVSDGWRHRGRRTRANARLSRSPVGSALFLCHGNVCRSPYGEARLRSLGGNQEGFEVGSAGLMGPGRSPPETGQRVAAQRGLDLSLHRSRLVDSEMVAWADLVVVIRSIVR